MIYLDVAGSAVLIQAPEDITSLDELDLPDGVELTETETVPLRAQ